MEIADFGRQYRTKTDDELLRLRDESEKLTPEARDQLEQEIENRGLGSLKRQHESPLVHGGRGAELPKSGPDRIAALFPSLRRFLATVRKWRQFKAETGAWPVLSMLVHIVHAIFLLGWAGFLIWLGFSYGWGVIKVLLILAPLLLVDAFVGEWIAGKIRLYELRRHRRRRNNGRW